MLDSHCGNGGEKGGCRRLNLTCPVHSQGCLRRFHSRVPHYILEHKGRSGLPSSVAMHPALQTNDIISLIFEELKYLDNEEQTQLEDLDNVEQALDFSSLSALARTCKAFYEPAMQILCKRLVLFSMCSW